METNISMKELCTVIVDGAAKTVRRGETLALALGMETPCGGRGKCGKCRVTVMGEVSPPTENEKQHLGEEALARGIRLACCAKVQGDCRVETASAEGGVRVLTDGWSVAFSLDPTFSRYGVAVDIGTTTIAAKLYDAHGRILAEESSLNPQTAYGADVVSRIQAALDGRGASLAEAVRGEIDKMIVSLAHKAAVSCGEIDGAVIVGNTVMLHLLTEESPEPLSHAPFAAKRLFGEEMRAREIGLSSLCADCAVYLPPCISAFVGADTTAAMLAVGLCDSADTGMLVDIGTNGEIALWENGGLTVCSTAAGPAFEGVGISCGMRGARGAIDAVTLDGGELSVHTIEETAPIGLCGSGLVDAVACLLDRGDIDETGYLEDDVVLGGDVVLTAADVRQVQLAKGAIHAGMKTALIATGSDSDDVAVLYVAGGFGSRLNMENAGKIGLILPEMCGRVRVTGNSAISGAAMLLLNGDSREKCRELCKNAAVLELSSNPTFTEAYMDGMMFLE